MGFRHSYPLERIVRWDAVLAVRCNRASDHHGVRLVFRAASRLGNGVFWYALMGALVAVYRAPAVAPVLHMIATGLACTAIYKWLKGRTLRPRPYAVHPDISLHGAPLDPFSFPSGHTLHAVAFTAVALAYYPHLAWLLLPFTALVAASRVVLGLHYPSDVAVGAVIGGAVAAASLSL